MQPVVHELEDVCFRILPSKDLDVICNVPEALLKSGGITRMGPEHPRFWRPLLDSVGIFNSKLGFPVCELAVVLLLCARPHPTPPRPTSAVHEPSTAHFCSIWLNMLSRPTKSRSREKGTLDDGVGGVSGRSRVALRQRPV
jgi:hypothetical protein